jgi:hypothetical protein
LAVSRLIELCVSDTNFASNINLSFYNEQQCAYHFSTVFEWEFVEKVNYYKVAKKTIHKPSLDHNMIVTKIGVTLGPSTRKIEKSREDTAKDSQPIMDAAPINRKLSNCEKTRVHHPKRYVAWIFDKRMNPLYNSYSIMDSKTKKKFIQNASSQSENLTTKTSRIWGTLICYQFFFQYILVSLSTLPIMSCCFGKNTPRKF